MLTFIIASLIEKEEKVRLKKGKKKGGVSVFFAGLLAEEEEFHLKHCSFFLVVILCYL